MIYWLKQSQAMYVQGKFLWFPRKTSLQYFLKPVLVNLVKLVL